jgi:Zn-dependent peptidase ImmA (M78 family)/transcriptional regulator with XRE-family HTH domain
MQFNPQRLSIARKRKMLKKKAFADLIGVTDRTLLRWDKALSIPTEENIAACVNKLGFPREFFFGPDVVEPNLETTSFRSQSSMAAATRDAVIASGAIGFLVSNWVEARFDLPKINVPSLHFAPDPETASRMLREEWCLGEIPITNMIHLLESKGVRIFSLVENTATINAYAHWHDDKPFVFLNTFKTAECSRFDAAHELAHLTLHRDGKNTGRIAEDQAHAFASAFLMPKADVLGVFRCKQVQYLGELLEHKVRWKVSIGALAHRLHRLGLITDWRYRELCIEIARKGYRTKEPNGIAREKSVVWDKVIKSLWSEGTTHTDIARDLSIPSSEVAELLFGVLNNSVPPTVFDPLSIVEESGNSPDGGNKKASA